MSRYIDADVLKDDLVHNRCFYPAIVDSAIRNTPTADVEKVRHGEWETIPDYSHALTTYLHICSECKTTYKDIRPKGHNYCHICGAYMRGANDGEE
jgi:protein-arginine kinase activator protein McsA